MPAGYSSSIVSVASVESVAASAGGLPPDSVIEQLEAMGLGDLDFEDGYVSEIDYDKEEPDFPRAPVKPRNIVSNIDATNPECVKKLDFSD